MGVLPVGKLLAGMAIPMMISMLVQACYNVVDSVFVAQLSEDALNAVSLAFPLQNLMIAFGAGTAVGINALLSRSLGEKNQAMADQAANTGIFLALCNFVVFALIGMFFSRPFFELQAGGEQVIVDYGVDYASICLGLSIGIFSQFCFERLLQSTGRTILAMMHPAHRRGHQHRHGPHSDLRLVRPAPDGGGRRRPGHGAGADRGRCRWPCL